MTIPLLVCIAGLLVWLINSRMRSPDPVAGEAGKWAYILGLAFTLAGLAGTRLF